MSSSPTAGIGGEAAQSESQQGGAEGLRAFLHDACAEVRRCGWCGGRRDLPLLRRPNVRAPTVTIEVMCGRQRDLSTVTHQHTSSRN